MPQRFVIAALFAATLLTSPSSSSSARYEDTIDVMLGQKQMLDIRYFCSDDTPTELCKTPVTQVPKEIAELIVENKIGGIILFAENIQSEQQIQSLTEQLQNIAANANLPKLFIAVDQEGGRVSRLPYGVGNAFAGNMAIGATYAKYNTQFASQVNSVIAEQISALGFNVNFAPTVDVNVNPLNPVINVRSYGESASVVAELGIASVIAMQEKGVISAMKHFPGHGDTHVDSHTGLPLVEHSRAQIDEVDLFPFSQAIATGGLASPAMIMTAHIQYPNLDATRFKAKDGSSTILPATMSRKILTEVLREELNYDGLIVTDALDMAGIAHYMDESEAMLQTFYAGADIALMPYTIRNPSDIKAYQAMIANVRKTILEQDEESTVTVPNIEEMQASTVRILATKRKYLQGERQNTSVVSNDPLERQLARAAITPVMGYAKMQLNKHQKVGLVMPDNARCEALSEAMKYQSFKHVACLNLAQVLPTEALSEFVAGIDVLIVGDITPQHSMVEMGGMDDLLSWRDRADKPAQYAQISSLLEAATKSNKQRIFVAFRAPYIIEQFKMMLDSAVVTYDYRIYLDKEQRPQGVIFDLLAEWFAGKFEAEGRLPVTVNISKDRPQ